MRTSAIVALVLALAVAGWLLSGLLGPAERTPPADGGGGAAAERPPERAAAPLRTVRVQRMSAVPHTVAITVRGRTEAGRRVELRSETEGRVVEVAAARGDAVRAGALLGRMAVEEREARLAEFEARLRRHRLHHDATVALAGRGLSSREALAAAQADVDAAKAAVEQMEIEVARTRVRAPFDGVLLEGHAEVGDYLRKGDAFAEIIDLDPILVVGSVTERAVGWLRPGMTATATGIGGQRLTGTVRYIAPAADPAARTYRVEIEAANPGNAVREGLTADLSIEVATIMAHFVSPALFSLADDGAVGLKTVDSGGRVRFRPVDVVEDTPEGIWLTGLPHEVTVITVGQDFVTEGQEVEPVDAPAPGAPAAPSASPAAAPSPPAPARASSS